MAIYKKLSEIQKAIKGLETDKKGFNYDYISGNKILGMIRPLMDDKSLLLLPEVVNVQTQETKSRKYDKNAGQMYEKSEILYVVTMRFTWVDSEDGETLPQMWTGAGQNEFDKGFGSALTYGERYYLLKLFHIQTDKDDVDFLSYNKQEEQPMQQPPMYQQVYQQAYQQPQPPMQPQQHQQKVLTDDIWWRLVTGQATGQRTKSGLTCRDSLIQNYHVDQQTLSNFDAMVADIVANNNRK